MDLHTGQAEIPPVTSGITDLYTGQASFRVNYQEQVPDNDRCANTRGDVPQELGSRQDVTTRCALELEALEAGVSVKDPV